jgi:peptidoglycan/xylan/chitin deacetylase (PgdA/CDA1 family)
MDREEYMNKGLLRALPVALLLLLLKSSLLQPLASVSSPATLCVTQASTVFLPILVYHHIRQSSAGDSYALRRMTVTPEIFERQMKHLQDNGYHVVPFASLEDFLAEGKGLPAKPVIITFDDGWEDQYTVAFPILEKYSYPAAFFVVTNYLGDRGFLSLDQLRAMANAGMRIGSHSRSHPYLGRIRDPNVLRDEIFESKKILEAELSVPITEFAYPYGSYSAAAVEMVKFARYKAARACNFGVFHSDADLYRLSAVTAPGDLATFERVLSAPTALTSESDLYTSCMRMEPGNDRGPNRRVRSGPDENREMLQAHAGLSRIFDQTSITSRHHFDVRCDR